MKTDMMRLNISSIYW